MNLWVWAMSWWESAEDAQKKSDGQFGLVQWLDNVEYYFSPNHVFLSCGTYSDPAFSPIKVPVINSGAELIKPYEPVRWNYSGCAFTAAMAYAIYGRWDLLVMLDTDILIGAVDFDSLLREFMDRSETLLTNSWFGRPGGSFVAWKPKAAAKWMHQRKRANLVEDNEPEPMLIEDEFGEIYKGQWWNPWPDIENTRMDYGLASFKYAGDEYMSWPFVRLPHPDIIEEYTRVNTARAIPVK